MRLTKLMKILTIVAQKTLLWHSHQKSQSSVAFIQWLNILLHDSLQLFPLSFHVLHQLELRTCTV